MEADEPHATSSWSSDAARDADSLGLLRVTHLAAADRDAYSDSVVFSRLPSASRLPTTLDTCVQ